MKHSELAMLAVDSSRSRAYAAAFKHIGIWPSQVIYLADGPGIVPPELPRVSYFDNETPLIETLREADVPVTVLPTRDINAPEAVEAVAACAAKYIVYSGPGGALLRRPLFATGKRFIHIHPGALPEYRGSTTIYYSLLREGQCAASAMFLNEYIDTGEMLLSREFPPPDDPRDLDHGYDPYIRSKVLTEVLLRFSRDGHFNAAPQPPDDRGHYYIMHPLLRHITMLSRTIAYRNYSNATEKDT